MRDSLKLLPRVSIVSAVLAIHLLSGERVARAGDEICAGDCDDDGIVKVNELVKAVNIALRTQPLTACPAANPNGDDRVTIAELITAVNNALYGCNAPTPTRRPTRTATSTRTATATPTPTATPTYGVDISGTWRSDRMRIRSSSCPDEVTDALRDDIEAGNFNCEYTVDQDGPVADVVEQCPDSTAEFSADVDPSGLLTVTQMEEFSVDDCRFVITGTFAADMSRSPTTVTMTVDSDFEPSCGISDCRIVIEGRFTRVEASAMRAAAGGCAAGSAGGQRRARRAVAQHLGRFPVSLK